MFHYSHFFGHILIIITQKWFENGSSSHDDFSKKVILITAQSFTTTQRIHSFEFTLVNESHSQHFVKYQVFRGFVK